MRQCVEHARAESAAQACSGCRWGWRGKQHNDSTGVCEGDHNAVMMLVAEHQTSFNTVLLGYNSATHSMATPHNLGWSRHSPTELG